MKINTNICVITGNVTRDAELRYTAKQTPVLGFTVACNRQGQDGQSAADFFPVVLWGKSAEALEKYLTKGKSVLVKGRLQTRSYESKTGEKHNVTEIVADNFGGVELLGGGERAQGGYTQQPPAQNQRPQSARGL
jgi:single-strand DNA-binding protein